MYKNSLFQYLAGTKIQKQIKHANYIQNPGHTEGFICNDMESWAIFPITQQNRKNRQINIK